MKVKSKKAVPVAKGKTKAKATKASAPKGEKMVNTGVRFAYSRTFAKALGRDGSGKGKARRNDVKTWAVKALNDAMAAYAGSDETDEDGDSE